MLTDVTLFHGTWSGDTHRTVLSPLDGMTMVAVVSVSPDDSVDQLEDPADILVAVHARHGIVCARLTPGAYKSRAFRVLTSQELGTP